jgi:hypothetical protein
VAFVDGGQNFVERRLAQFLTQRFQPLDRLGHFGPPHVLLRHNPSDRFAVAGDANCPASFHLIEKLGELRFGVGRLEFEKVSYGFDQLLGRVKHTALFAAALRMLHAAATSS